MGLFGGKKDMPKVKASELLSDELIQKINSVVATKNYGIKYDDFARSLVNFVKEPDKEYTEKDLRVVVYSAGIFTKLEPDLANLLNENLINKYKELKKNKQI